MPAKKRKTPSKPKPNPTVLRAERGRREARHEDSGFWDWRTQGNRLRGAGISDSRRGPKAKKK